MMIENNSYIIDTFCKQCCNFQSIDREEYLVTDCNVDIWISSI